MQHIASLLSVFTLFLSTNMPTDLHSIFPLQHVVCIDAGHGADDPGAINNDISEAEETLNIAKRLQILLEENNYSVIMTRKDMSTNPTNSERAALCNKNHADVAIAIHLNANDNPDLDYTQNLYGTKAKDGDFSQLIHQTLENELQLPSEDNTDFDDNFLIKTQMPATLVETVFITNPDEYAQLTDGTGNRQEQIAKALYDAISKWFSKKHSSAFS